MQDREFIVNIDKKATASLHDLANFTIILSNFLSNLKGVGKLENFG